MNYRVDFNDDGFFVNEQYQNVMGNNYVPTYNDNYDTLADDTIYLIQELQTDYEKALNSGSGRKKEEEDNTMLYLGLVVVAFIIGKAL
tara:strand:- start:690 stop:953 length:264 start_codon:yes stop_codon:yes gene_type:complete